MGERQYITISRVSSNQRDDYISIVVRDGAEGVTVEMSMDAFALAVTGMGHVPVEAIRRG